VLIVTVIVMMPPALPEPPLWAKYPLYTVKKRRHLTVFTLTAEPKEGVQRGCQSEAVRDVVAFRAQQEQREDADALVLKTGNLALQNGAYAGRILNSKVEPTTARWKF
jgi:hypothetical protein